MAKHFGKPYVVKQITLKEALIGTGSNDKTLNELVNLLNEMANNGYRCISVDTEAGGSKGFGGGDRMQATCVFELIDWYVD